MEIGLVGEVFWVEVCVLCEYYVDDLFCDVEFVWVDVVGVDWCFCRWFVWG